MTVLTTACSIRMERQPHPRNDMVIKLTEAIKQIRDDLRQAVVEAQGQDILFTPSAIEVELTVSFETEAKADGGVKLLTFLDLSGEGKVSRTNQHKIKLTLEVADKHGQPLKVSSNRLPNNLR